MMRLGSAIGGCLCLLGLSLSPAQAEIERVVADCETQICFNWWPKLPVLEGWQHDRASSLKNNFNVLLPGDSNFDNAPAVIYAQAMFKLEHAETKSLAELMAQEQQNFSLNYPSGQAENLPAIKTADGEVLQLVQYTSSADQSWELVAYGEEGNFYLVFSASASNQQAFETAKKSFLNLLTQYKR